MTSDDITADTVQLSAVDKRVDPELVAALTSESGVLAAGSLPTSGGATADSDKNAWDTILKVPTQKAKKERNTTKKDDDLRRWSQKVGGRHSSYLSVLLF